MAEVLIKALDHVHPDAVIDRAGSYKRGHPVVVMPDGHPWGKEERPPKFVVLRFPGLSVDALRAYCDMWWQSALPEFGQTKPQLLQRRRWRFRLDAMPQVARDKLDESGVLTVGIDVTWTQLRGFLRDDQANVDETKDL
jgi:hypothetical protein